MSNSIPLPLSDMLDQEVIFHDNSVWPSKASLNWKTIIAKSRNKYGSHVDLAPPQWLNDLRYYPAANADVITLLLLSFGEALLEAATYHLASNGQSVMLHKARTSLNGICFQQGVLVADSATKVTADAHIMLTEEYSGQRTILGGVYADRAFILGLDASRRPVVAVGNPDEHLEDLEHKFLTGIDPIGLNRAQRRAMRKNKS
jgi:hypothetical protein